MIRGRKKTQEKTLEETLEEQERQSKNNDHNNRNKSSKVQKALNGDLATAPTVRYALQTVSTSYDYGLGDRLSVGLTAW